MPKHHEGRNHTVRPETSWKAPKSLLLILFALAGGITYWRGTAAQQRAEPPTPSTATASVRLPGSLALGVDGGLLSWQGRAGGASVRQYILSGADEQVRANVRVNVAQGTSPDELEISLTASDLQGENAARTANRLVQSYAESCRTEWKTRTERVYRDARDAASRAERESREARSQLETFYEQQFHRGQNLVSGGPGRANSSASTAEGPSLVAPQPAENPQWRQINDLVVQLEQRRTVLLSDRTPNHPEVEETDIRIREAREQLARIPQWLPGMTSNLPGDGTRAEDGVAQRRTGPHAEREEYGRTNRTVETLKRTADEAARASDLAARTERLAWQARLQPPRIDVQLAESPPPAPAPGPNAGLLLMALAAGLTAATGVGMVWAGKAIEPVLIRPSEIERSLRAPVIGSVPGGALAPASRATQRLQRLGRAMLLLTGAAMLAGCAAAVILHFE